MNNSHTIKKSKKVIKLDEDRYLIEFDKTSSYPIAAYIHGEKFMNLIGDNLIYQLCAKIDELETALFKLNEDICNDIRCVDYVTEGVI